MKLHIVIDLGWAAPVLRLVAGWVRRGCARLVRLHASQLHPLAPTFLHRRYALQLSKLEAADV